MWAASPPLPWPGVARPCRNVEALRPPRLPGLRRGRSAPRAPRVTLSMEKESPESQPRGHPPWQSPWGTPLLLGKRSRSARPCPTGATPHQARNCLSRRRPPKDVPLRGSSLTTHKTSREIPGFSIPPAGSLASRYHPYSSEYGAGTCPRVAETQPFFVFSISLCYQVPARMGVARWPSWCVDAVPCQKHIGAGYCARTNGVQFP